MVAKLLATPAFQSTFMSQTPRMTTSSSELVACIDAALPQTQCTRCGFPDCHSYAQAIAAGTAAINQCPPGGAKGIARLSTITGQAALPLSPEHGQELPRTLALIDESWCIGCTLCIKACPTDAIVGANKRMHTVIAEHCTGCELCLPVCPVDCIALLNASGTDTGWDAWSPAQADHAHLRYQARNHRLSLHSPQFRSGHTAPKASVTAAPVTATTAPPSPSPADSDDKKAKIAAILAKSRAQRAC